MADYKGGGGGGAAVVPASQVVASDREDEALTQAGLVAAIAALPAGGGDIYIGAGALSITSTVTIDRDVKLIGAGIGSTNISIAAGVVAFSVGAFEFSVTDLTVTGDASAGQVFIFVSASAAASRYIILDRILVSNPEILIDADLKTREVIISNCNLTTSGASGTFILDGGSVALKMSGTALTVTGSVVLPPDSKVTTTAISGTTVTVGTTSVISASVLSASSTLTVNATASISSCTLSAVTAGGARVKIIDCVITSFTSATNGVDQHILIGNRFTGAGNNVTLTDCDNCVVKGNVDCQVSETASSDGNRYANISTSSTIIGATSVIEDAQKFVWTSPGVLTTTDNDLFARIPAQVTTPVRLLSIEVETAPTGASVLVTFRKGTRSTGVLAAAFATLTLTAGSFTASTTVAGITIATTEFLVVNITQVGSVVPGSSATIVARG